MRQLRVAVATFAVAAFGLVSSPTVSSAQKALVYCPPVDVTGCDNVVAALAATGGPFPGGVDRGYDGNAGSVNLASVDLSQYSAFVVPSLSDDSSSTPYALLRNAIIASRLNAVLGRVALWSGTPDIGSTNAALKETLLRNLAAWVGTGGTAPRSLGLVALQDFSDDEAHRYGWVAALTGHSVSADTALQSESSVQSLSATGATILDNGGTPLTYGNLASFGLHGTSEWSSDAKGADGGQIVLMTATAVAAGESAAAASAATVTTDKSDYPPFDTVTVTGAGWQPGETVSLLFHETPQNHLDRTLVTTADASGDIRSRDYATDDLSLNVTILLTATGQSSGRTATITFTDGPCVGTVTLGPQSPSPIAANGTGAGAATAAFPVTVARKNGCGQGSGGTAFSVTLSATGFPATGSLSPSTLAFSTTDNSKSSTLTVTVPATVAPKSYGITVTATNTAAGNDNDSGSDSLHVTGGVGSVAIGSQSPSPLAAGQSATFTVTVNRGSSTGNFTANLALTGLPAGTTGTFVPASVAFTAAAQTSRTSTLTITSPVSLAAGSYGFTVSATNPLIVADAASATASLVTSSPATKLAFTTSPFSVRVGLCSPKITIQSQNANGIATNPSSATTIALSTTSITSPIGQFFSDAGCATGITTVTIPTTTNSTDLYYKDGTAGSPTLTATDNNATSPLTSASQKETITGLPATTTTVATSDSPSEFGEEVTFTATVAPVPPATGTPTGTVQYSINGTATGAPVTLANGVATFTISTLAASNNRYVIAAAYSGDANFGSGTGQLPTNGTGNGQMVNKANTATSIASSKNPSNPGESVIFSATVAAQAPGGGVPTGTVQLQIDGTSSGSPVALTSGTANFPASVLTTTGTHTIAAIYANQDGNYNTSTGTLTGGQVVRQTPTTLVVTAATGVFGGVTTLSATLTTSSGALAGQSVAFTLNGQAAGSATTDASGHASVSNVSLTGINAGTYASGVSASFIGGSAFGGSTGSNSLTVAQASQLITFNASGLTKKFGDAPFSVASLASASSGLAVTFTSTTVTTCTVTSGGGVTIAAAGACTITASQGGNTNFQAAPDVPSTFTIGKATATLAIDPATLNGSYNGSAHAVTVTTTPAGLAVVSIKYGASATAPVDAGSYDVVATLTNNNFDAPDVSGTLVIDKSTPTVTWATPADINFGTPLGSTQLDATAKGVGGAPLSGTFGYTPAAGEVLHAGTHSLSVSFAPTDSKNYNGVAATTVTLTVLKADQTIAFGALAKKTYGNAPLTLGATASSNLAVTYATAAPCAVSGATLTINGAGTCTITASQPGDNDYNKAPDVSQQLIIDKAPLTITADDNVKLYGAPLPTFAATYATFVNGDSPASLKTAVSFQTTATQASPVTAGGFRITPAGATSDNYDIKFVDGTLTITPAPLTITADDKQKVYGDALPPFTVKYETFVNGDNSGSLGGTLAFQSSATQASSVAEGPYAVTPGGLTSTNYTITFAPGKLTVTPAPLTVTAEDAQKVYGDALPPFTVKYDKFVNGDNAASLGGTLAFVTPATQTSSVAAGPYAVTPAGLTSTNYTIAFAPGKLTVTPAPLTITAEDKQKVYGDALPPFTVKYDKFVNGDNAASLGGTLAFLTPAAQSSPVVGSPYAITPGGLTSTNYTISFAPGKLTVTPAPLTITAENKQKVYGDALPPFTVKYETFVNGDNSGSLRGTLAFQTSASQASSVAGGPYSITPGGLTSSNYSITFATGYLTVTPAPLTITTIDRQKVFDGAAYPFNTNPATTTDVTYSGFVLGETPAVLGGPLNFSQFATIQVGSYTNIAGGLTSTNYSLSYAPGRLTILAWTLAGYYQPVDMSTGGLIYNTVKGGSTVPLKFNVYQASQSNANERTDVGAVKAFTATPAACSSTTTDDIEIVTTGGTSLRYDITGHQFVQNWLTPKTVGACYQVTMTTLDGSKLTAFFKLK
jgi:hypothetical protein